jgi:hypothetical protein
LTDLVRHIGYSVNVTVFWWEYSAKIAAKSIRLEQPGFLRKAERVAGILSRRFKSVWEQFGARNFILEKFYGKIFAQ